MVPGSAPGTTSREGDLATSSAEQRTRTFDVAPAVRAGIAGPATGDVLKNRFVLHQCLADGSTSRLFRALDRRREAAGDPDPWVVLKVVTAPPDRAAGEREPRALQALRREAAIAQGLSHPNLPCIVGIDHEGPHTFLCMAWIEGESLAAILDSRGTRPMTRVQALHILDGVGKALVYLHGRGITHADVKPGNILVTAQGEATLLDFGVALGPGAGDLPAVRGFTPEYASPEVLAGGEPTPADDLFSLACVAYRMLGGHRAFGSVTAREAAETGSRPARPGHLSVAQWRALDRALSFDRAGRQPDVATFLAQLKGARDETLAATDLPEPEPTPAPARASGRARTWPRLAAGALALAIAGILGAWWLQRAPGPTAAPVPALPMPAPAPTDASVPDPAPDPQPVPAPVPDPAGVPVPGPAAERAAVLPDPVPPRAAEPALRSPPPQPAPPVARTEPRRPPAEPAGPPVPEPAASPPPPLAQPAADPAASSSPAVTATAARTVPFSSLTVRRYVEPAYPRIAASRRVAGWVDVGFAVEPSGRTSAARVIEADPPGLFDEAALAAVRRWRFAPVEQAGAGEGPVTTQIRVRFDPL